MILGTFIVYQTAYFLMFPIELFSRRLTLKKNFILIILSLQKI